MHDFGVQKEWSNSGLNTAFSTNLTKRMKQASCLNWASDCFVTILLIVTIVALMCNMINKLEDRNLQTRSVRENYTSGNRPADITLERELFLQTFLYGRKMVNRVYVPCAEPSARPLNAYRGVHCYSDTGEVSPESLCSSADRPDSQITVPLPQTPCRYNWYWSR